MSELVVLATSWIFEIIYRSEYVGLLVLHLLLLLIKTLAHYRNVVRVTLFIDITLVYVHLNWLYWFCFLILVEGPVVTLIECMIFLLFLDVVRLFMSAVYFLKQSDVEVLCLQSVFLWSMIQIPLSLKLKQSNLFKRPSLSNHHSSKTTNAESAQANAHAIITV